MESYNEIFIKGIDETRPPKIQKEPYIDLFFKLSRKAPPAWCSDFNDALARHPSSPKVKPEEGLYIDTWVRKPEEISTHLELLKRNVRDCNQRYTEKLRMNRENAARTADELKHGLGEQGRLNRIIAELDFKPLPAEELHS